jgi:hypothetical protein
MGLIILINGGKEKYMHAQGKLKKKERKETK